MIRRCILEEEMENVLHQCHSSPYKGHFRGARTTSRVWQSIFYLPTLYKDAHNFMLHCNRFHWVGNISNQHETPLNNILEVELFDV